MLIKETKTKADLGNKTTSVALAIGILVVILIIAALVGVMPVLREEPEIVAQIVGTPEQTELKINKRSMVKQAAEASAAAAAAPVANLLRAQTTAKISAPEVTQVTESLVGLGEGEFGVGNGFGGSGGGGSGSGGGMGSGSTLFGSATGLGLKGRFYDLKQTPGKKLTDLGEFFKKKTGSPRVEEYKKVLEDMVRGRFAESRMDDIFKSKRELSLNFLAMEEQSANAGPVAFGVQKEVEAAGWLVRYEGRVIPPREAYYRFVGIFDDMLLVYVDNKIVFDGSLSDHSGGKWDDGEAFPGLSMVGSPMRAGRYVKISPGDQVMIIVGESRGGRMGGGLFIQEKDKTYKTQSGGPILPPFATRPLTDDDKKRLSGYKYPVEVNDVPLFRVQ